MRGADIWGELSLLWFDTLVSVRASAPFPLSVQTQTEAEWMPTQLLPVATSGE